MFKILFLYILFFNLSTQIFAENGPDFYKQNSAIQFIENKGQITDDKGNILNDVLFRAEIPGAILYVTTAGLSYLFFQYDDAINVKIDKNDFSQDTSRIFARYQRIDMNLIEADIKKENIIKSEESSDYSNYYKGQKPGVLYVHSYGEVVIKNIYPGIDWVLYNPDGKERMFKQDFIVNPGADYRLIKIKYAGPDGMNIHVQGKDISVSTALGQIHETDLTGISENTKIDIDYIFQNDIAGFQINDFYDITQPLIIDPAVLVWCTYYGGTDLEWCYDIKSNGSKIIVGGHTYGVDMPLYDPGNDAYFDSVTTIDKTPFVILFDSTGKRLWATYVCGDNGLGDFLSAVAINDKEIFITGRTNSTTFPVLDAGGGTYFDGTKNTLSDFFISKFNLGGVMLWSTYFGGTDWDYGSDIYCDEKKVWVTGYTSSDSLITVAPSADSYMQDERTGNYDAFFIQFNVSGELIWSTYFGGNKEERSYTLSGNGTDIWIAGQTKSSDLPVYDAGGDSYFDSTYADTGDPDYLREEDAFLTRFDSLGVLKWSTYFGGDSIDYDNDIYADEDQVLLVGRTTSLNFPIVFPGDSAFIDSIYIQGEGYIAQFSTTNELLWSTYFGNDNDGADPNSIVAHEGYIYLTGDVGEYDAIWHLYDPGDGSYFDSTTYTFYYFHGFLTKFDSSRKIVWSTYFIQSSQYLELFIDVDDNAIWLTGIIVRPNECIFPAMDPGGEAYYQDDGGDENEIFIAKFTNCFVNTDVSQTGDELYAEFTSGSYQWINCVSGDIIAGATYQNFIPDESGSYAVIVTEGSCLDTSDCFDVLIDEIENLTTHIYSIYPNPASGELFVALKGSITGELFIYDIVGQTLFSERIIQSEFVTLDISNLTPGNYLVKLIGENGNTDTQKFTKVKME